MKDDYSSTRTYCSLKKESELLATQSIFVTPGIITMHLCYASSKNDHIGKTKLRIEGAEIILSGKKGQQYSEKFISRKLVRVYV